MIINIYTKFVIHIRANLGLIVFCWQLLACASYVRLRNSAQIRVLESHRVLHNVYLILIGVKLRSILDEF